MKSYEIWMKSGQSLLGTMSEEDAQRILNEIKLGTCKPVIYEDGDGDMTIVQTVQIEAFAYRDEKSVDGIGFSRR